MIVKPIADIVGAGTAVALDSANDTLATSPLRWVMLSVTGTGTVRIGDSTVSASKGVAIVAGSAPVTLPWSGGDAYYFLSGIYAFIPVGATLNVSVGC